MGDILHALPAARYLRKAAPGASVHWAVETRFADLLAGNPSIDRVIPLDIRAWKGTAASPSTWRAACRAARDLRAGSYDAAFDVQGNVKSGVVTLLSGAPLRYGFPRDAVREGPNAWFTNRRPPASVEDRHVTQKILRVVSAPFGLPFSMEEFPGEIVAGPDEETAAFRLLEELIPGASPRLAVHPGTTWNTKRMDPAFWAGAIRILREAHPGLGAYLSWGTEREREECAAVRDLAGGRVALLPHRGYRALAAVLRACGHAIGPDTGPLHLAAAAGAKTVSVFRGSDGGYAAPRGPGHRFLQAPMPCTACQIKGDKVCPRDAECRASISPAAVAAGMAELMAGCPRGAAGGGGAP